MNRKYAIAFSACVSILGMMSWGAMKLGAIERANMHPDGASMLAAQRQRDQARIDAGFPAQWRITAKALDPEITKCHRCGRSLERDPKSELSGEVVLARGGHVFFDGCFVCLEESLTK